MTWAKLDDRLHADPRLPLAGFEAFGLHCAALTWMGAFLTDGEITAAQVKRLAGRRGLTLAAKLVSSGFWIEISPEKWVVFEWETYLISREEVERDRARKSELGRAGARAIHAKRQETPPAVRQPDGAGASDGSRASDPDPVPTRPDPRREDPPVGPPFGKQAEPDGFKLQPTGEPPPKRRKPETAIPDGWGPSAEHLTLGRSLGFDEARVKREGEKFADGARAKDRRYVDWHAAFANWLRNEQRYAEQRGEPVAPLPPPEKRPTGVRTIEFPRGRIIAAVEAREAARKAAAAAAAPPEEPEDDTPELSPEEFRALKDRQIAKLHALDAEHGATDGR